MAWYSDDYFEEDYFLLEEPTDLETIAHVAFLRSFLALPPGSRILDLACGSGRLSVALARLGYRVVALDSGRRLLDHAQRAAAQAGQNIEFVCQDMRALDFDARFDFAFSFLHSFGYFRDEENLQVLRRVHQAL
ncbi:MAG: methyltransferase domain-containing protein, partial [Candidatus Eremiobacterota bacterium]